jgi:hypothetical protein
VSHSKKEFFVMKYKIYPYKDGFEIAADREALMWISEICQGLANLTDEEAKTGANHYHLDGYLGHAEPGSTPVNYPLQARPVRHCGSGFSICNLQSGF